MMMMADGTVMMIIMTSSLARLAFTNGGISPHWFQTLTSTDAAGTGRRATETALIILGASIRIISMIKGLAASRLFADQAAASRRR